MSRENVELVRRFVDLINLNDWRGLEEILSSRFEWHTPAGGVNAPRVFRGVAEARKWWQSEVDEAWDTQESHDEIEEIFDLGDLIVAVVRAVDVGATSGIMVDSRTGIVWELEAGKIERLRVFLDPEEALRAAGLETQT